MDEALKVAIDDLRSVLCDPDGGACVGSPEDRHTINQALAALETARPAPAGLGEGDAEWIAEALRASAREFEHRMWFADEFARAIIAASQRRAKEPG